MMNHIDIAEDRLSGKGNILHLLLKDQTTRKNILWCTDSYESRGDAFTFSKQILPGLVTGIYGKVIQPRAAKSREEQIHRTRDKAEVFTPLQIVKKMNDTVDKGRRITKHNWQEYVSELRLEITCGEAPYIVSRYDPVSDNRDVLPINKRVGFLDKKLRYVSKYCKESTEWFKWAKIAFQSSYGYEWQGDNILIARENLLYTFIGYYAEQFEEKPSLKKQEDIAEIISWNIFQMDGLKYVIPLSCKNELVRKANTLPIIGEIQNAVVQQGCAGCKNKQPNNHNGKYVKVMDWRENNVMRFIDLLK